MFKNFFADKSLIPAYVIMFGLLCFSGYQYIRSIQIDKTINQMELEYSTIDKGVDAKTNLMDNKDVSDEEKESTDDNNSDIDLSEVHWHDGELHGKNHELIELTPDLLELMKKQSKNDLYTQIRGVSGPPPKGYKYRLNPDGTAKRDQYGQPMLYKIGEPIFEIETHKGFAPTLKQYQQFQDLELKRKESIRDGNSELYESIKSQMSQLRKDAHGDLPYVNITITLETSSKSEHEAAYKRAKELSLPILYEEYRKQGLSHLIPKEY